MTQPPAVAAPGTARSPRSEGRAGSEDRDGRRRYWEGVRFLLLGRALPATLFAGLGVLILRHLVASVGEARASGSWVAVAAGPVRLALYFLFCAIPVAIYLTRPMPRARDGRLVARLAALTGTTMLLVVGAVAPSGPLLVATPAPVAAAATLLLVVTTAFGLWGLLHLRHSFSISPEARRLVTGGPYRIVRHPLYAAEIGTALALVLPGPRLLPVAALAPFIAVQLLRMSFEERLLERTFPEYRSYERRTPRLLPGRRILRASDR